MDKIYPKEVAILKRRNNLLIHIFKLSQELIATKEQYIEKEISCSHSLVFNLGKTISKNNDEYRCAFCGLSTRSISFTKDSFTSSQIINVPYYHESDAEISITAGLSVNLFYLSLVSYLANNMDMDQGELVKYLELNYISIADEFMKIGYNDRFKYLEKSLFKHI